MASMAVRFRTLTGVVRTAGGVRRTTTGGGSHLRRSGSHLRRRVGQDARCGSRSVREEWSLMDSVRVRNTGVTRPAGQGGRRPSHSVVVVYS